MTANHQIIQRYDKFAGLDLRSSEVAISPDAASSMRNAEVLRTGTLSARRGYKAICPSVGGLGLAKYARVDLETGEQTVEILPIGQNLYKRNEGTFSISQLGATSSSHPWFQANWFGGSWFGNDWLGGTVSISGSSSIAACSILADADTNTIVFSIIEDGVETLSVDLGLGYDELTPLTLAELEAAIGGLSGFSVTITGDTTVPAAFLPTLYLEPFVSGVLDIPFCYDTEINQPSNSTDPFQGAQTNRNESSFVNCSWVNKDNVIYIASAWDELKKYDAQKIYRAGMPTPATAPSGVAGGAGNVNTGDHGLLYTYYQKDAQGNGHEGAESALAAVTAASAKTIAVTVSNIVNTTGFNTDRAQVNGNQSAVTTITVDTGQSLKVGDTAYFYNTATSAYVERVLTAVTTTSITFAGAVSVLDNQIVSANLRIRLWATAAGGQSYYLVADVPNDSSNATQAITYNISDTTLSSGTQYLFPLLVHDLPPKFAYITVHQGTLTGSGVLAAPNTVYYSPIDSTSQEHFSDLTSFVCQTVANDSITGIFPGNEFLVVFKKTAYFVVSGLILTSQFRVDLVSTSIGSVAHATIKDVDGYVTFCSTRGPYRIVAGGVAESISDEILPVFSGESNISDYDLTLSRAVAENDSYNQKYILFLPAENTSGGSIYASQYSRTFVLDYYAFRHRNLDSATSWWEWTNLNMEAGILADGKDLYWSERRVSTALSTVTNLHYKRGNRGDQYDFADHAIPVDWEYVQGWDALGEPSIYKKYLRIKTFAADPVLAAGYTLRVRSERSFIEGVYDTDLNIVMGSSAGLGYGLTPYGDNYGDPNVTAVPKKLKSNRSLSMRFTFSHNTLYAIPLLSGWEVELVAPYRLKIED